MARECEIKMQLTSDDEAQALQERALGLGFRENDRRTELDFVPDTPGFGCRQAGLLLRFREIRRPRTNPEILLTLKVKNTATQGFQDNEELELYLGKGDQSFQPPFDAIRIMLRDRVGIELPERIMAVRDFQVVYQIAVQELRMIERRALVEKHRRTLVRGSSVISLDVFPEEVGLFIELETQTPEALHGLIDELGLAAARLEERAYAQLVEAKKADQAEIERRTCLFPETRERLGPTVKPPRS
jgi:hypothetical protein